MSEPFVYFVGPAHQVAHHARPLQRHLAVGTVTTEAALEQLKPGDVAVFVSEHFEEVRETISALRERHVATLYAIDGILEWRNAWDNLPDEKSCPWTMRPCLADKVAVIGPSQARTLAAWGNVAKVELVGVPRFDRLWDERPEIGQVTARLAQAETLRMMVITAKCPGFTPEQVARTRRSLADLRDYLASQPPADSGRPRWEVIWRLTAGLDQELGVETQIDDLTGADLATQLASADVVVSTASTAMLEAMIGLKPVVLLDYHNVPQYVPTAWRISAAEQIASTLESVRLSRPLDRRRLSFQEECLADSLWASPDASARMARLISAMHTEAMACIAAGQPLRFSRHLLPLHGLVDSEATDRVADESEENTGERIPALPRPDYAWLYPEYESLAADDPWQARSELAQVRRELNYVRKDLAAAHEVLAKWQRLPVIAQLLRFGAWWQSRGERRRKRRVTTGSTAATSTVSGSPMTRATEARS
ncbi:MAG: hypothetical protein R3B96_16810 [Pirellulaceae bacterium]